MTNRLATYAAYPGSLRLDEAVDRMFQDALGATNGCASVPHAPAMDVVEDAGGIRIAVELPGFERKDVEVGVADGVLTLRAEKRREATSEEGRVHFLERRYGEFRRALALPESVDASRIEAVLRNGVLTLTLPKREESRPRSVEIRE
jgi:HSP20 family protein